MHEEPQKADDTVQKLKAFDAHDKVFVIIAHDPSLIGIIDFFPQTLTDWNQKDWAETVRWRFLADLKVAVETN